MGVLMLLSFKTQLDPNNRQLTKFRQHAGVARHAYNWAHSTIIDALALRETDKTVKVPSAIDLHKLLVAQVKPSCPWYYESSKNTPQHAIANARLAWDRCFKKTSKQPRFKKKGRSIDSFYLEAGTTTKPLIKNDGKRIKLPKIGWVRLHEPLPVTSVASCTISRKADRWYISIKYDVQTPSVPHNRSTVGVDIGIKTLAVCSNGVSFENPKAYRRLSNKIKHLQRAVSRKVKGSHNRKKAVSKLAIVHARVSNIRKDAIHKLTTYLSKNHGEVKIEDLNVFGMLKNHRLAGAIADCGMHEFRRQLEYKTIKYSSKLSVIDRWYPSSQICSSCNNHRQKMPLKVRVYECPSCGSALDRDINAARNIEQWYEGIAVPRHSI